jgi:hypothetical protein
MISILSVIMPGIVPSRSFFPPTLVARGKHNFGANVVLNLPTGISGVVWIGALTWAIVLTRIECS